jgi:hypothetical protein
MSVGRWRYSPATVTRWVSLINQLHTAAGLPAPGKSEVVPRALSGVRRIRATHRSADRRCCWRTSAPYLRPFPRPPAAGRRGLRPGGTWRCC